MVGLFPELHFSQFAMVPTVADDAMLGGRCAGEISGLRSAGDGGKGGHDFGQGAGLAKGADARHRRPDERLGQADDVDDSGAMHSESKVQGPTSKVEGKKSILLRQKHFGGQVSPSSKAEGKNARHE